MTVYNRRDITIQCLNRLYANTFDKSKYQLRVYLTNDGCTDGTKEAVESLFPNICIVDGDGSLFWNRGMYVAWKEAVKEKYDYYLWPMCFYR